MRAIKRDTLQSGVRPHGCTKFALLLYTYGIILPETDTNLRNYTFMIMRLCFDSLLLKG